MANYIDARTTLPAEIQADVCIVGGGAAGVTLAVTLARPDLKVVLIESGSLQLEGETQQLYNARQTGLRYYNMAACRLRYFGGTTNHWSGYCRENDPIDYEGRPDMGVPAWPITYDEISPYVKKAISVMRLPAAEFDPFVKAARHGVPRERLIDSMSDDFETKVFQIVPKRRIHDLHGEALAAQGALDIYLHANVTHLQLNPQANRVVSATVKTLGGTASVVKAKAFVLCAHAVENARLLLASNDVMPMGIGNRSDHVGRYFMEHANVQSGLLFPSAKFPVLYNYRWATRYDTNANLGFSAKAMRREKLLQYYCRFVPIPLDQTMEGAYGHLIGDFWSRGSLATIEALKTVAGDMPGAARFITSRLRDGVPPVAAYELDHRIEQAPNPDSRVTLGPARDALGVPEVVLHWALNDLDYHTFSRGQELMRESVERLGLGRVEAPPLTPERIRESVKGHFHHIGTTRMSARPEDGVVDRDCRVHGVGNLYVGGSSIFTTAGYSGPTMMIVAFALRLAEHLQTTWKRA
ncbi:FAD-dependent oxidoreductase [Pseudorhodoferax sp. Leaf274]|uniref:FAD-dependent oxidoreductase n=1 Tax=Pseudorhodoferax sp. Leaf274 TaxID=1736318 RepID=UPI000702A5F3|nr:GMC family oxidoreductase [Pseudorhodoferax sp. Leaf274]KQP49958.1 hypothetical protein ASF44_05155 [Pseudorhodoferax sp. Leaf274]